MKVNLPSDSQEKRSARRSENLCIEPEVLEAVYTNKDQDLKSLSETRTVMLVFLRHFGCSFCREAMSDLAGLRAELEQQGVELVMVHMSEDSVADAYFEKFNLAGVAHISDPDLSLYEYFGLHKGSFWQLYGLKTWVRGIMVGYFRGMGLDVDKQRLGDSTQMPGVFLLRDSQIVGQFVHKSPADRPNYRKIAKG